VALGVLANSGWTHVSEDVVEGFAAANGVDLVGLEAMMSRYGRPKEVVRSETIFSSSSPLRKWGALPRKRSVPPNTSVPPKSGQSLTRSKVISAACADSGSRGMPDRDECDWDLGGLYYIGHLEVNIAPWKGSVRRHPADEPAEAEIY
jgi:hypothetical protein